MTGKLLSKRDNGAKIFFIVFLAGVLTRVAMMLAGVIMLRLFADNKEILNFLANVTDAEHYMRIAKEGYSAAGDYAYEIVFYPLFPWLVRIFASIIRSHIISGLIISYSSFGLASAYLYKLMRLDYDKEKTADALLLLFIAPYGVFFMSAHTESLFLMLSVMTLYYSRKENWILCGVLGFFAALTKTQGMLLIVPVAYEFILCSARDKRFNVKGIAMLLIPMGFAAYLCLNKAVQGDFFAYIVHQANAPFYNSAKWVSDSLAVSYATGMDHFSLSLILYFPQIIMFFIAVALIFAGLKKKVRTSYLAFMGIYVLVTYLQGWMISGARYITSCVSCYIVLAAIDNKIIKYFTYLITGLLTVYTLVIWFMGYAIM